MRITVGALKGGVAKTMTAMHLAAGLARTGRTLLVDADPQAATALDWSTVAGDAWPTTVIPWHGPDLARRISGVANDFEHVVIDTGGESDAVLGQALMVTDQLIIPASPSLMDLRRLPSTVELAARIDAISPLTMRVLLCKVRPGTRSATDARELLDSLEVPCMAAEVRLLESLAAAFGTTPADLSDYQAVLTELTDTTEGTP
ncbi:MAG: AAA family ATPase [Angustibacter sp.]